MSALDQLFNRPPDEPDPPALEAIFHEDVTDPTELAKLIIPSFDYTHVWQDVPWMPRGDDLPAKGDQAVVIMTEQRRPWVLAWQPS